jgi:molybdate transport system ATP-binding protein
VERLPGKILSQPAEMEKSQSNRDLHARVRKRFTADPSDFTLDVDFIASAGITILFGSSGAGKSTLLDCISGLVAPDAGHIEASGQVWFKENSHNSTRVNLPVPKRNAGYVFQDLALFPHLSVKKNVEYGLAHLTRKQRSGSAASILETLRISHLANRKPDEISGGERQRVALARALVTNPTILLLDEPLAALDAATKSKILDDLRAWNAAHRIPILYVTHSREEVFALGDRAIVLEQGKIIAQGAPHEVLGAPQQETVAQLAGFENIFAATVHSLHPERGTMICRVETKAQIQKEASSPVELETPLVRAQAGASLRVGVRAGDILLAIAAPVGLSARNIIPGRLLELIQRDVIVVARVDCGVEMEVHLTLAARDSLQLTPGKPVWLVIKTHSCHLMQR